MEVYDDCKILELHKRHQRVAEQRGVWRQQQLEREVIRKKEHERKRHARQQQEERWRELDCWYHQQPDRPCLACRKIHPASCFGYTSSRNGSLPILHTRCKVCHEAMLECRQHPCCICQKKTPPGDFLSHLNGYALRDNGISLSLCCKTCETALLGLSQVKQCSLIRSCCQRTFPTGQVIYAENDPETQEARYIGRTNRPRRRHAQHLQDLSPLPVRWGPEKKIWYTRGNWIQALADRGLKPSMEILQTIELSPLVLEWEQRYIWHAIQQGWNLLNLEAMDEALVVSVKTSSLDFLHASFDILLQQQFFSSTSLIAFLRIWHQ